MYENHMSALILYRPSTDIHALEGNMAAVTSASPSSLFNGFISTLNTACFLSARLIVRSERWTDKIFIKVFSNHNWVFNVFKESFRKLYLLFISWIDRTTLELAWSSDLQQTWMHQKWMNTCVIFDVLCVCMLHFFLHRGNHLIKPVTVDHI